MTVVLSRKGGAGTGGTGTAQALSIGVSTGGNTSGNTTVNSGSRFVIVGSNGITASQGTAAGATTVTLSGITQSVQTQGVLSAGVSTGGNTSGDTTVNTGSRFVLAGGDNITLSQATAAGATTVTISAGAGGAGGNVMQWPDMPMSVANVVVGPAAFTSAATRTTMNALVFPMPVYQGLSVNYMRLPAANSMTSATSNSHWGYTAGQSLGIYTLTGGSLSLLSSFSNNQLFSYSSAANSTNASATWSMSYGSGTALSSSLSVSTNNAGATALWSQISSSKWHPFATGAFSLSAGQYWGAWAFSSSTSGANLASLSIIGIHSNVTANTFADVGSSIGSTFGQVPLVGVASMTQTNTAMPVSIGTANISSVSNAAGSMNKVVFVQMISQFT